MKYKSKVVEASMLRSVRREAGLGDPPEEFTTNACESINAVIKAKVEYKRSDLPYFLTQMSELIDCGGLSIKDYGHCYSIYCFFYLRLANVLYLQYSLV